MAIGKLREIKFAAASISAFLLLSSCTGKEPAVPTSTAAPTATSVPSATFAPTAVKPEFTKDTYPRIDGSTATIPLSQGIAKELLGLTSEEAKAFIKHNTTHNAYVNLMDGKADIIFVTEPSAEELTMAKDKGIELEVVPVVKEAFVFLLNVENPVDVLTQKQIQDIYQGKIVNWKDVGGPDKEIIAYQRPDNSGSQTLMLSQVMKGLEIAKAPVELKPADMSGLIEVIAAYDNSDKAIGYSVYYYANSMYSKDTIKFVKVDGVEPNNKNISSDAYPYTSAYYAVLRKTEAKDSGARKLLLWILSDDGQKVSEDSGYVPLR
ncbi:PstS family phosphate ABC transporter substrate-binding protein [Youngiibacter multivorans]|uniref:Phosphate transport system substrate-binding protein n=1 Tax=Youngiibacter multivorans TaxID=937251 RepID=A0ABS4G5W0_9CLOT|nr:PstS family phosphate ABC transporter substrate-binding protein [Youngiibacter multivorans]MBP1919962.1 phosphate transport system substrate-binding protein [Youngiibacter multivorans]